MVKHFLSRNALHSFEPLTVCDQLVTRKQFDSSLMVMLYSILYGIPISLVFIFGPAQVPHHVEIGKCILYLAIAIFLIFTARAGLKLFKKTIHRRYDSAATDVVEMLCDAIFSFKNQFGANPEKLGPKGVAIRLTSVAKKIFECKEKHDEYSAEIERERLRILYDAAQVLFPVNTYPEIFEAAEEGKEAPEWIADFAK